MRAMHAKLNAQPQGFDPKLGVYFSTAPSLPAEPKQSFSLDPVLSRPTPAPRRGHVGGGFDAGVDGADLRGVRGPRARARHDRHLRSAVVPGVETHAGN